MDQAATADMPAPRPLSPTFIARLGAAVVLVGSLAILGLAAWLQPDPKGQGTHEQLGLSPCTFLATTGLPCPSCGMTTAFAHAAHGRLVRSFLTQPAGAILAVGTAAAAIVSAYALVRGISLTPLGAWLFRPRPMVAMGVIAVAAWVYKTVLVMRSH